MKLLAYLAVSLLASFRVLAASDASQVFRNDEHGFSFRHPKTWERVAPQAKTTIVMLYARDGSGATANVSVIPSDRASAREFDEAYFSKVLSKAFSGVKIKKVRHSAVQGRAVAYVEYDFTLSLPSKDVDATSLSMTTVHNGKRYMLVLNVTRAEVADLRDDLNLMAGTFLVLP